MYQHGSNGVDGPMVSAHTMCFEHTCECLGCALHVRQANVSFRPGPYRCSALLLLGPRDLEHPYGILRFLSRLVRCLPAHVLFTVLPPGGVVPRHDLDAVVDLVNRHFVGSVHL